MERLKDASDSFVEGLFDKTLYKLLARWKPRVIVVEGPFGVGKTILLGEVCRSGGLWGDRSANENVSGWRVGAAFSFEEVGSVQTCILSLASQLGQRFPQVQQALQNAEQLEADAIVLFRKVLSTPLQCVSGSEEHVVVVLDSLDQASQNEKEALEEIVLKLWTAEMPSWIGLVVSTRQWGLVDDTEAQVGLVQLGYSEDAILKFVSKRLAYGMVEPSKADTILAQIFDTRDADDTRDEDASNDDLENVLLGRRSIAQISHGCFFLAREFVDMFLEECPAPGSLILERINECIVKGIFKKRLNPLFRRFFERALCNQFEGDENLFKDCLSVLVVAREPLSAELLERLTGSKRLYRALVTTGWLELQQGRWSGKVVAGIRFPIQEMAEFVLESKQTVLAGCTAKRGHAILTDDSLSDINENPFIAKHRIYHLCMVKDWAQVEAHLLDFDWLYALACVPTAFTQVVEDLIGFYVNRAFVSPQVSAVVKAMQLGAKSIAMDPLTLAQYLFGTIADQSHPVISSYWKSAFAASNEGRNVVLPELAVLTSSPWTKEFEMSHRVDCVQMDDELVVWGTMYHVFVYDRQSQTTKVLRSGHGHYVHAVAFDAESIVSLGTDNLVVWDRKTGLFLHGTSVRAQVMAMDDGLIVVGSKNEVRVWDKQTKSFRQDLKGHGDLVSAVAIRGKTVVSGSTDLTVRIWCLSDEGRSVILKGHEEPIGSVALDDSVVVSADCRIVKVWDRCSGEETHSLQVDRSLFVQMVSRYDYIWACSPNSFFSLVVALGEGFLVVGSPFDAGVQVRDLETLQVMTTLPVGEGITAIAVQQDTVVSTSVYGLVRVCRLPDRSALSPEPSRGNIATKVEALYTNGERTALLLKNMTVTTQDKTGSLSFVQLVMEQCGSWLGCNKEGGAGALDMQTVAVVKGDTAKFWDCITGAYLKELRLRHSIWYIAVDGDYLACASNDTFSCWNWRKGSFLWQDKIDLYDERMRAVALKSNLFGKGILSCGYMQVSFDQVREDSEEEGLGEQGDQLPDGAFLQWKEAGKCTYLHCLAVDRGVAVTLCNKGIVRLWTGAELELKSTPLTCFRDPASRLALHRDGNDLTIAVLLYGQVLPLVLRFKLDSILECSVSRKRTKVNDENE